MTLNLVCFSSHISAEAHSVLIVIGRHYVAFIRCLLHFVLRGCMFFSFELHFMSTTVIVCVSTWKLYLFPLNNCFLVCALSKLIFFCANCRKYGWADGQLCEAHMEVVFVFGKHNTQHL